MINAMKLEPELMAGSLLQLRLSRITALISQPVHDDPVEQLNFFKFPWNFFPAQLDIMLSLLAPGRLDTSVPTHSHIPQALYHFILLYLVILYQCSLLHRSCTPHTFFIVHY